MLTEKEVKHISGLARIELSDSEVAKYQKDLSSILGYVEKLNSVDTQGVEPLYQTTGLVNAMRMDKHIGNFKMDDGLDKLLIGQAPASKDRAIKVKSVLAHK